MDNNDYPRSVMTDGTGCWAFISHRRWTMCELRLGESPLLSPPGFRVVLESGWCDPDSVDLAGRRGVGAPARRSVLGGRHVAQRRVAVSVVVFPLKSPMTTRASNSVFQWLRLRHSFRNRLLNDSM